MTVPANYKSSMSPALLTCARFSDCTLEKTERPKPMQEVINIHFPRFTEARGDRIIQF